MAEAAFVLGATGLVGRELVRQLCVRGSRVVAHVRPDSSSLERFRTQFSELGAEVDTSPWQVDALAAAFAARALGQIYLVFGTTRAAAKREGLAGDIYERVDLGLTELTVAAAQQARTAARLVYLSSVGANALARSAYLRARGKAEAAIRTSGLPWVTARPSIIVGDRDDRRRGEGVAAAIGDGVLSVAGLLGGRSMRARYRSISADVLASALIRIGEGPEHDRVFDGDSLR